MIRTAAVTLKVGCPARADRETRGPPGRRRAAAGRRGASGLIGMLSRRASPRRAASIRSASPATVGDSKSARRGISTPSRFAKTRDDLRRQERVAAEVEEVVVGADRDSSPAPPPRSMPPPPRPVRGVATKRASAREPRSAGVGQGLAVDLAVGRQWERLQDHECRWEPCARERGPEHRRSSAVVRGPGRRAGRDRRPGRLAGCIRSAHHDRLAHRGVPRQRGLDLAELDPEAANLDLAIDPAQVLEFPSGRHRARSPVR